MRERERKLMNFFKRKIFSFWLKRKENMRRNLKGRKIRLKILHKIMLIFKKELSHPIPKRKSIRK